MFTEVFLVHSGKAEVSAASLWTYSLHALGVVFFSQKLNSIPEHYLVRCARTLRTTASAGRFQRTTRRNDDD